MYKTSLILLGVGFSTAFGYLVMPPLLTSGDVLGAFAGGFVNPYASAYALDAIFSWCVLAIWVVHEARSLGVRHGWLALALGVMPGVAAGLVLYLLLRTSQLNERKLAGSVD